MPTAGSSPWRRFRDAGGVGSLLLALGFYLVILLMDVWPLNPLAYRENQYLTHDIYARATFNVRSSEKMSAAREDIKQRTPAIFRLNPQPVNEILSTLKSLPTRLAPTTQPGETDLKDKLLLDDSTLAAWKALATGPQAAQYAQALEKFHQDLLQRPIVLDDREVQQNKRKATEVTLVCDGRNVPKSVDDLIPLRASEAALEEMAQGFDSPQAAAPTKLAKGIAHISRMVLLDRPIYQYDDPATQQSIDQRLKELADNPPIETFDAKPQNSLLVAAMHSLTSSDIALLKAENQAWQEQQRRDNPYNTIAKVIGRAGLLALIGAMFFVYLVHYERRIVKNHWHGLGVILTLLLMLAINKAILFSQWNERVAVLTVMMAGIILTIAYNHRFALAAVTFLALLTVLQLRGELPRLIVILSGASAAILQLRDIRGRSKLIFVGLVSSAVVFVAVWASSLSVPYPLGVTAASALWAAAAAILAGFIAQGILPLIERFFGVATSMTLLEWCDASKPLMRRLAMEAPGTFNHSLQLGAMCEAAAESIGARGLLARAGAYYHDIGKINKPEYFVENQGNMPNPHAKLSPAMSLLIIIGHVKDGLEMAREYGLPEVLREFITSHHGTTLVQFFYHAATEQRKADADRAPDEVEFRYPGPKPRSREAAILMLADASESSVRAMPDPTPGRIETQVHSMVSRRLMDGQLDECDLTLREVHQIEASLIRSLCGVYHSRIAYPKMAAQRASTGGENGHRREPASRDTGREATSRDATNGKSKAASRTNTPPTQPTPETAGPVAQSPDTAAQPTNPETTPAAQSPETTATEGTTPAQPTSQQPASPETTSQATEGSIPLEPESPRLNPAT